MEGRGASNETSGIPQFHDSICARSCSSSLVDVGPAPPLALSLFALRERWQRYPRGTKRIGQSFSAYLDEPQFNFILKPPQLWRKGPT